MHIFFWKFQIATFKNLKMQVRKKEKMPARFYTAKSKV